jgi:hypothetical protein
MKKLGRVQDLLFLYQTGGMKAVSWYLLDEDLDIKEDTWVYKAKKLLESKNLESLEAEIQLMLYNFKLGKNERSGSGRKDS